MIHTISLTLSIFAFGMALVAWIILRKLCAATAELAAAMVEWAEQVEAEYDRQDNLLKRARLKK